MNKKLEKIFILGDNWLYYKIYTGPKTSETILTEIIKPIANKLIGDKIIDKWFFIRYSDPKYHLRIRFHYLKQEYLIKIVNSLNSSFKKLLEEDIIYKLQTDTYKREIERYGLNTIDLSEELFFYDSIMIVNFIDIIEGIEGEELRWLFSLRAIDSFLNSFNLGDEEKMELLNILSSSFRNEFDSSKFLGKQLSSKFRENRNKIESFMIFSHNNNHELAEILDLIEERDKNMKIITSMILTLNHKSKLQIDMNNLLVSYIHMFMNRLFRSKNRLHEMVCYDFLFRYYKSALARK